LENLHYKKEIAKLSEEPDFEKKGDEFFLNHPDPQARMEWAFYRPSGSHPKQIEDEDVFVSIMAFNHSRLGAYERFKRLNKKVIKDEKLRVKIRNRSRMLFRSLVDDDFKELVKVLKLVPEFKDLAIDQVINGKIWNDVYADPLAASEFVKLVENRLDEKLKTAIIKRLIPVNKLSLKEGRKYLLFLIEIKDNLHPFIRESFRDKFDKWVNRLQIHPLQRIVLQKEIKKLVSE
jgi:hypothetical protein